MAFCLECRKEVDELVKLSTHSGKGWRKSCKPCKDRIIAERKARKSLANQESLTTIGVSKPELQGA